MGLLYKTSATILGSRTIEYATSTFSVHYPYGYLVDERYENDVAPGRLSRGVKFTVDPKLAEGTNLSPDSYVSVEWIPTMVACSATPYLYDPTIAPVLQEGGRSYSVAMASQGAAGNLYEETVYTRLGEEKGCMAVRYHIHSLQIGNFDPGTVKRFDREKLLRQFDAVRRSLTLR